VLAFEEDTSFLSEEERKRLGVVEDRYIPPDIPIAKGHTQPKERLRTLLSDCKADMGVACKTLFPDRFWRPFGPMHKRLFDVLADPTEQRVVVIGPRGFGKTSLSTIGLPANNICFNQGKYIVPVSASSTSAVLQSENLKRELETNEVITQLFPPLRSAKWSEAMWDTSTGIRVMPRGQGQQIRGLLYDRHRPDLIICDDLETKETARSAEQTAKIKEWFWTDLYLSVDKGLDNWRIIVIGTLLGGNTLLGQLVKEPGWTVVHMELCDADGNSNWPEFMPTHVIQQEMEAYRSRGDIDLFWQEYRGIARAEENAPFRSEFFRYYEESDNLLKQYPGLETVVLVDPAKTTVSTSADSAIVGVGVDVASNKVFVRDIVAGKMHPDQMYTEVFNMVQRLDANAVGLEVTSLHEYITHPFKNEMFRRGINVELIELHARGHKEDRIKALVPMYRQGYIHHNRNCCGRLEEQLVMFPDGGLIDIVDALAYVVGMMDEGERFFSYDLAAERDEKDLADEYTALEKEYLLDVEEEEPELASTDWRIV